MSNSSDFEPILGKLNWEIPAEVRLMPVDLRIQPDKFESELIKSIHLLQSIADDRLQNFTPFPTVINEPKATNNLLSNQEEIDYIKQLLKKNLGTDSVMIFSELPKFTSEITIEEEKIKIAEKVAKTVYDTEQTAKRILNWEDIKNKLCPSIHFLSDDVFAIVNHIIGIAAPLSLGGTLSIPLQPMLWAWIILIISRVGVKNLCKGYS